MKYYKNLDSADIEYFCEFDQVWKIEQWRFVKDYESYKISDLGRVKSLKFVKQRILKQQLTRRDGYCFVALCKKRKIQQQTTHKLVAIEFLNHVPNGYSLVVNHENFIKTDNRALNLEITTQRKNTNKKHIKSKSKYVGVSWHSRDKKWTAYITINGKIKHLGNHINEIDANNAYQRALSEITNNKYGI